MIKLFIRLSWLRRSLRDSEEELDISLEDGWELLIEELSDMLEDLELDRDLLRLRVSGFSRENLFKYINKFIKNEFYVILKINVYIRYQIWKYI